jgi:hypothetical protein
MLQYTYETNDAEGFEITVVLPGKLALCPRCGGAGKHDHPVFANGLTQSDFDEDSDFRGEYLRGTYDVRCETCKGERVVCVPDEALLNEEQKKLWNERVSFLNAEAQERSWERQNRERGIEY